MTASVTPLPIYQFFANNGAPLAGGKVYTTLTGTTTPASTWQDKAQTTLNSNPVILDAAGRATIWCDQSIEYRWRVTTALDVTVFTEDNVNNAGFDISAQLADKADREDETGYIGDHDFTQADLTVTRFDIKSGFNNAGYRILDASASNALRGVFELSSGSLYYRTYTGAVGAEVEKTRLRIGTDGKVYAWNGTTEYEIFTREYIATDAQARAFSDNTVLITPNKLGSAFTGGNQSTSNPGHQNLPGGLQFRFGSISVTGVGSTHVFDQPFPTACLGVIVCDSDVTGGSETTIHRIGTTSRTASQFVAASANNIGTNDTSAFYIAIGY